MMRIAGYGIDPIEVAIKDHIDDVELLIQSDHLPLEGAPLCRLETVGRFDVLLELVAPLALKSVGEGGVSLLLRKPKNLRS